MVDDYSAVESRLAIGLGRQAKILGGRIP